MTDIPFRCDAFVDQGRKIGDDPIGYKCSRVATGETEDGTLLCDSCRFLLATDPERLTFGPIRGKLPQQEAANEFLRAALGKPKDSPSCVLHWRPTEKLKTASSSRPNPARSWPRYSTTPTG